MSSSIPRVYAIARTPLTHLAQYAIATHPSQPQIPQVVSLLPSEEQLTAFLNTNSSVTLKKYASNRLFNLSSVQLMSACRPPVYGDGQPATIDNLLLGLSHSEDLKQVLEYRRSLGPDSNVVLMNPDRAVGDKLVEKVWNDVNERPNVYQALSDIIVWEDGEFTVSTMTEGAGATTKIARLPRFRNLESYEFDLEQSEESRESILGLLRESSVLGVQFVTYGDFALAQAEQMIIKTVIGSLSALFDCRNAQLLRLPNLTPLMAKHISECINIIFKSDPVLHQIPESRVVLNRERIMDVIVSLLKRSKKKSSVMRKPVDLSRHNEVRSTVGWFAEKAIREKVPGGHNVLMSQLITAKLSLR